MSPVLIATVHPALIGVIALLAVGIVVLLVLKNPREVPGQKAGGGKLHWLLDHDAEGGAASWHIGQRTVSVGRSPMNFVQINVPGISRVHCQLHPTDEGLKVIDMSSSNGTVVNGERIRQHILSDNDVLRVGTRNLLYRSEGDFGSNAGFSAKAIGRDTEDNTHLDQDKRYRILMEAHLAYNENGENMEKAAELLGLTQEQLRELLEE
jgi:predicted component of type VI protein secretion system